MIHLEMSDNFKAYTIRTCSTINCLRKVVLNKNHQTIHREKSFGIISKFKCPVCLNRSVSSDRLFRGTYTQCHQCNVYFIIEDDYSNDYINNDISICYMCDEKNVKNISDVVFMTDKQLNSNPISYSDIASSKYKIIQHNPSIEVWTKYLELNENRTQIYHNTTINWDIWDLPLTYFAMNYGYWTIVPDLPIDRKKFLNKNIFNESKILYYYYYSHESINIYKDMPANCVEYSLVLKTKNCYVYFTFVTYLSNEIGVNEIDANEIGNVRDGLGQVLYEENWKNFVCLIKNEIL